MLWICNILFFILNSLQIFIDFKIINVTTLYLCVISVVFAMVC